MARKEGAYILLVDFLFFGETNMICIPIQYNNRAVHLLASDDNDYWFPFGSPILNFTEITEKQLFEETKWVHTYYSSCTEGVNHRLKHLKLDCGQQFNSIYRPRFSDNLTECAYSILQDETNSIELYKDFPISCFQDYSNLLRQFEIIQDEIVDVFKVVAPNHNQFSVYGHAIRNIIILAYTKLDARMQSILT